MLNLDENSAYQQILDAIPDLVLVKGPKSRILWANKAFRDYYGMTNEQLRDLIDSPLVEPDMTQSYIRDDAKVFETGQLLDIPSEPVKRHDGVVRRFHTVKSPIKGPDGQVVMTIGISRDIEDRLHTEKLKSMLAQAEKLSAVGQLAAGVAHEINNPLGVILGFAESLEKRLEPASPWRSAVDAILRESLRCKALVQNLLNFSRQKMPGRRQENPQDVLNQALVVLLAEINARQVRLVKKMAAETHLAWMDNHQIQQVIFHLCANALDAMPHGGDLTVASRFTPKTWICAISDTGKGIPKELEVKIFEPFFTTKEVGHGTGLGLSLSYQIVQRHHGELTFKSNLGQGSTFTIELPLDAGERDMA